MEDILITLEQKIRNLINIPRKKTQLLKNDIEWNKLCSSLDVLGDTNLAIEFYLNNTNGNSSNGEIYIFLYGILQVLFVQQDATKHLCEALSMEYIDSNKLKAIREIRNNTIGHPTKRGNNKSFSFIVRFLMSKTNFTFLKFTRESKNEFIDVNVLDLICNQKDEIKSILQNIVTKLLDDEKEYRKKYMNEKLVDLFPQTLSYHFEKAYELTNPSSEIGYNVIGLKSIAHTLDNIKNVLTDRGIYNSYDVIKNTIELIEYALNKVNEIIQDPNYNRQNFNDVYIYITFINNQVMDELYSLLKEMDEYFEREEDFIN